MVEPLSRAQLAVVVAALHSNAPVGVMAVGGRCVHLAQYDWNALSTDEPTTPPLGGNWPNVDMAGTAFDIAPDPRTRRGSPILVSSEGKPTLSVFLYRV